MTASTFATITTAIIISTVFATGMNYCPMLISYVAALAVLWILLGQSLWSVSFDQNKSKSKRTTTRSRSRSVSKSRSSSSRSSLRLVTLTILLLVTVNHPSWIPLVQASLLNDHEQEQQQEPSPSFLEQLMQSLNKLRSAASTTDNTPDNSKASSATSKQSHQYPQQQQQYPQHPSNTYQTDPRQPGQGLTFQHARRLSLYQVSLFQHYKQLWTNHQQQNNNLNTTQLQFAIESAYQHHLYGFHLEPSLHMLQQSQSQSQSQQQSSHSADSSLLPRYYATLPRRQSAFPPLPHSLREARLELLHDLFTQAWDAYLYHAFPAGEVAPLSCRPREFSLVPIPGLTLIDGLDTLLILGNTTEFARSVERLRQLEYDNNNNHNSHHHHSTTLFDINQNVSVFETTIRVLGGLLSAHQMATAWLPQVVIYKSQVFVIDDDDETMSDNHVNLESLRTVRTGRHDAYDGKCSADASAHDGDDTSARESSLHHHEPLHRTSMAASSLQQQQQQQLSTTLSVSLNKRQQAKHVWKNNTRTKQRLNPQDLWSYDGYLLELARDIGNRLLPAFSTPTGIPYGTVHLQTGVPDGETPVASLAGGGTLVLEFELLSQLTGDEVYGRVAKRAARSLWIRQTSIYLMGKHIDTQSGSWTETLSGIGSNSDSYYEYLAKQFFVFYQDADFFTLFVSLYAGIFVELRRGDWYVDSDMNAGARVAGRKVLESLMAFFPGLQILVGEHAPAARSLNAFFAAREYLGFLPERFQFEQWRVDNGGGAGKHPLRPELLESAYLLNHAMPKSRWEWGSEFALQKLQDLTRAPCGFASLADVKPHTTGSPQPMAEKTKTNHHTTIKRYDEMPSFFLTETLKYLYLTFDNQNNILHKDALHRDWVFTTEAHPIHMPLKVDDASDEVNDDDLDILENLLRQRLTVNVNQRESSNKHPQERVSQRIEKQRTELWSDQRQIDEYVTMYKHVQERQQQSFQESSPISTDASSSTTTTASANMMDPFFGYGAILQYAFGSQQPNDAHIIFEPLGLGDGWKLTKACPNLHSSDLMFVHAMHGDSLDYTPRFATSLHDTNLLGDMLGITFDDLDAMPLVSTATAMALWGSGYYQPTAKERLSMLEYFDESSQQRCLLPHKFQSAAETKQAASVPPSNAKESHSHQQQNNPGFTEISTEMGTFQVTAVSRPCTWLS